MGNRCVSEGCRCGGCGMVAGACGGVGWGVESKVSVLGAGVAAGAAGATRGGALVRGRLRGGESLSLPDILANSRRERRVKVAARSGDIDRTMHLLQQLSWKCCGICVVSCTHICVVARTSSPSSKLPSLPGVWTHSATSPRPRRRLTSPNYTSYS